jgi:hypothetical protein
MWGDWIVWYGEGYLLYRKQAGTTARLACTQGWQILLKENQREVGRISGNFRCERGNGHVSEVKLNACDCLHDWS